MAKIGQVLCVTRTTVYRALRRGPAPALLRRWTGLTGQADLGKRASAAMTGNAFSSLRTEPAALEDPAPSGGRRSLAEGPCRGIFVSFE